MTNQPLFQQIAESIRLDVLRQTLQPGDEIPTIREMAQIWSCAPGTVQRAYQLLASQQVVVSKPGAGTVIAETGSQPEASRLRKAALIHRVEAFLIDSLSQGYFLSELDSAFQMALDRYRQVTKPNPHPTSGAIRFSGSHDPAISQLATRITEQHPDIQLQISFAGSLEGLMALSHQEADISGIHLWDKETDSYNQPFIRRLLPGRRVALVRLTDRQIGFLLAPQVKHLFNTLDDLIRPETAFINRQSGSGVRVWLDAKLSALGISPAQINGYPQEVATHTEIASRIINGQANIGVGAESCARAFGLSFVPLHTEPYDLVIPEHIWDTPFVQVLSQVLASLEWHQHLGRLDGYDTTATGQIQWVE